MFRFSIIILFIFFSLFSFSQTDSLRQLLVGRWKVVKEKFVVDGKETGSDVQKKKMTIEFKADGKFAHKCQLKDPGCTVKGRWRLDSTNKLIGYYEIKSAKKYLTVKYPDHKVEIIALTQKEFIYKSVDRVFTCVRLE